MKFLGYAGKILQVDLSRRKTEAISLDEDIAVKYLGGSGLGTRLLWEMTGRKTEPLGKENVLIFSVGPLTGTGFECTARTCVISKAPLTGIYGDSSAGGFFGPELKYAGYDAVVITGRASCPVYLYIGSDQVDIVDAGEIWNKGVFETHDCLRTRYPDSRVAAIGIGGENKIRFASIMFDKYRAAGRTGMGAVMGSKNLKALVVKGHGEVRVKYPHRVRKIMAEANKRLLGNEFSETVTKYGTTILVELMNAIGRFPTRNFQSGVFDRAEMIDGDKIVENYKMKDRACFGCRYACKNYVQFPWGEDVIRCDHPEYETLSSLGSRVGNSDLRSILYLNYLCDDLGLDTISTGGVIAFCMELEQRGLLEEVLPSRRRFVWGDVDLLKIGRAHV